MCSEINIAAARAAQKFLGVQLGIAQHARALENAIEYHTQHLPGEGCIVVEKKKKRPVIRRLAAKRGQSDDEWLESDTDFPFACSNRVAIAILVACEVNRIWHPDYQAEPQLTRQAESWQVVRRHFCPWLRRVSFADGLKIRRLKEEDIPGVLEWACETIQTDYFSEEAGPERLFVAQQLRTNAKLKLVFFEDDKPTPREPWPPKNDSGTDGSNQIPAPRSDVEVESHIRFKSEEDDRGRARVELMDYIHEPICKTWYRNGPLRSTGRGGGEGKPILARAFQPDVFNGWLSQRSELQASRFLRYYEEGSTYHEIAIEENADEHAVQVMLTLTFRYVYPHILQSLGLQTDPPPDLKERDEFKGEKVIDEAATAIGQQEDLPPPGLLYLALGKTRATKLTKSLICGEISSPMGAKDHVVRYHLTGMSVDECETAAVGTVVNCHVIYARLINDDKFKDFHDTLRQASDSVVSTYSTYTPTQKRSGDCQRFLDELDKMLPDVITDLEATLHKHWIEVLSQNARRITDGDNP